MPRPTRQACWRIILSLLAFVPAALSGQDTATGSAVGSKPSPPPLETSFTTGIPLPKIPNIGTREATVTAVYVKGEGKDAKGGTGSVRVSVADNPGKITSVGVDEEFYGGIGSQCKSSVWIAAMVSSQARDYMINDHRFSVHVGGHVDGPSMGMLLTATMLALLNGDKILPEVTMTGAVNPDGTAGPVAGIPYKIEGAKAAGFKVFGYPVGCRFETDRRGESVDIESRAQDLKMEAKEVRNFRDAYQLLTGKILPIIAPLAERELRLTSQITDRARGACLSIESDLQEHLTNIRAKAERIDLNALKRRVKEIPSLERIFADFKADLNSADSNKQRARQALDSGSIGQALAQFRFADDFLSIAEAQEDLLIPLIENGLNIRTMKEWVRLYEESKDTAKKKIESLRISLKPAMKKKTIGGTVDALHCYMYYGEAAAHLISGDLRDAEIKKLFDLFSKIGEQISKNPNAKNIAELRAAQYQTFLNLMDLLRNSTIRWALARRKAHNAQGWANFAVESGPPVREHGEDLYPRLGNSYASAAGAARGYLESLVFGDATTPEARTKAANFDLKEPQYSFVKASCMFAEIEPAWAESLNLPSDPLGRFTAALHAYTGASSLLMKYYAFDVRQPSLENGGRTEFVNRKILTATLDGARARVLEECAQVQAEVGFIPDAIKLNFDLASTMRDETDGDRLTAIRAFWRCDILCHITRLLNKP